MGVFVGTIFGVAVDRGRLVRVGVTVTKGLSVFVGRGLGETVRVSVGVRVAVAVGTPGIGYVNTALLLTHATDVFPIVATSAASCCGLGVIGGAAGFGAAPKNAALYAPCGPDHKRIMRSSIVAGIGVALPLPGTSSAP